MLFGGVGVNDCRVLLQPDAFATFFALEPTGVSTDDRVWESLSSLRKDLGSTSRSVIDWQREARALAIYWKQSRSNSSGSPLPPAPIFSTIR